MLMARRLIKFSFPHFDKVIVTQALLSSSTWCLLHAFTYRWPFLDSLKRMVFLNLDAERFFQSSIQIVTSLFLQTVQCYLPFQILKFKHAQHASFWAFANRSILNLRATVKPSFCLHLLKVYFSVTRLHKFCFCTHVRWKKNWASNCRRRKTDFLLKRYLQFFSWYYKYICIPCKLGNVFDRIVYPVHFHVVLYIQWYFSCSFAPCSMRKALYLLDFNKPYECWKKASWIISGFQAGLAMTLSAMVFWKDISSSIILDYVILRNISTIHDSRFIFALSP